MKEEEIIDVLDAIVSLPRRDVLSELLITENPITGLEISKSLNLSLSEVLGHLHVLRRVGLIDMEKNGARSVWFFTKPLELKIYISKEGISFRESKPSLWKRFMTSIYNIFKFNQ